MCCVVCVLRECEVDACVAMMCTCLGWWCCVCACVCVGMRDAVSVSQRVCACVFVVLCDCVVPGCVHVCV